MKKIVILLCIIWIGIIFYMSSNTGIVSRKESMKIANFVYKQNIVKSTFKDLKKKNVNGILRKNAHALEYLILAFLVGSIIFTFYIKGKGALIYILFICLLFAVLDEFHQSFIPGRGSLIGDVLIDFLGSIIGTGFLYLCYYNFYEK